MMKKRLVLAISGIILFGTQGAAVAQLDTVAAACAEMASKGFRNLAKTRDHRFLGKVEEYTALCRGGDRAAAHRDRPWVDWGNYWGTGDASSKSGWGEPLSSAGKHFRRNGRGIDGALLDLEYQRMELIKFNLFDNRTFQDYLLGRDSVPGRSLTVWPEMRLPEEHPSYQAVGGDGEQQCSGELIRHRNLSGICNDVNNPAMGSSGQLFARNVQFEETFPRLQQTELTRNRHGDRLSLLAPDPQVISRKLFTRQTEPGREHLCGAGFGLEDNAPEADCPYKAAPFFNVLAAFWIQFMTHDWFSHMVEARNHSEHMALGCTSHKVDNKEQPLTPQEIEHLGCDPANRMERALVAQVGPAPQVPQGENARWSRGYETTANNVTAWWDASQIYGYDDVSRSRVKRDLEDSAKLKLIELAERDRIGDAHGYLPQFEKCNGESTDSTNCMPDAINPEWTGQEAVAFPDNWTIGLSFFHNVFAREHNLFVDAFRGQALATPDADSGLRDPADPDKVIRYREVTDIELFEIARLVVSAMIAKIHTIEWTTQLLYDEPLYIGMNSNWHGLLEGMDIPSKATEHLNAKLHKIVKHLEESEAESRHTQWYSAFASGTGIVGTGSQRDDYDVGNPDHVNGGVNHFGSPFNFPEEFVSVYRLHALVPDLIEYRELGQQDLIAEKVPVVTTFRAKATDEMRERGLSNWALSMGRQRLALLELQNSPRFLQQLQMPVRLDTETRTVDVVALDIIRDRERGVPRFNEFRRQYGLKSLTGFDDFIDARLPVDSEARSEQEKLVATLREVYGTHVCDESKIISRAQRNDAGGYINDCLAHPDGSEVDNIEDLDTVVGWLAETTRPHGYAISETQFQVFILNASRRLFSDRFFTSSYRPEFYSEFGLNWVDNNGPGDKQWEVGEPNGHRQEISPLKRVLLRTMPELEQELQYVVNAFDPWSRDRGQYYTLAWQPRPDAANDVSYQNLALSPGTGWSESAGAGSQAEQAEFEEDAEIINRVQKILKDGPIMRAQHAKMLAGITNARFRVSPIIPEDLQIGFLQPGAEYDAVIRLSNAAGVVKDDDSEADLRGAAIRIFVDEEKVQDFLMTSAEQHHARDAMQAVATAQAFAKKGTGARLRGIVELKRLVGLKEAARIVNTLRKQTKIPVESLATETFWSRAPIAFDQVAVKYKLEPVVKKRAVEKTPASLRTELSERLAESEVVYTFKVQRYFDDDRTPIEDASVVWSTSWETVAELIIPAQPLDPESMQDEELKIDEVEFNPWHVASDEFRPLSSMNRVRNKVYWASQQLRRDQ